MRTILLLLLAAQSLNAAPNILFIYADDQSYRTLSCYPEAYDWVKTPNIDALAASGVRFSHAYIGTWCMPSRATILTGHHQFAVESMRMEGRYPGSEYDPAKCPFWPKVFREKGYVTAQIGKWHTGTDTGRGRDWDYQIVWNRPKYPENSGNYYEKQLITFADGETRKADGYSTDNYTQWASEFIRGEKGRSMQDGKPWYLWLCYGAIHGPSTPADRHKDALKDAEVPVPADIFGPRPGKPDWQQGGAFTKDPAGQPLSGKQPFADAVRKYHECVLALDEGVGKVMAALKESGQLENTLVVYSADQGFAWGQHGLRSKVAGYDAAIRGPLIFSMPSRLPQGKVCATPVGGVDLPPTFFRFAGLDLPWEMHGHDLTPLLENPAAEWNHPLLMTNTGRKFGSDTNVIPEGKELLENGIPWYAMIRQGRYKYIRTLIPGEVDEFYDAGKDPEELTNLARNPEYAAAVAEYRGALEAELRRTGAGFVDHLPPVRSTP